MSQKAEFDPAEIGVQAAYKLIGQIVVPRPIALVTTVDRADVVNAAPFSFFNAMSFEPLLVVIGVEGHPDRLHKDTGANIQATGEFVVNIVDEACAHAMNVTAQDFPPDIDELAEAGFTAAPSTKVKPPRILECPAQLECKRFVTLELGPQRQLVVGEVVHMAIKGSAVDIERLRVDADDFGAIGRMGGVDYVRTRDRFPMPRITSQHQSGQAWQRGDEDKETQ